MSVTIPATPVPGTAVNVASFGQPTVVAIRALATPPRAQLYQTTTATTIANSTSTWTAISFDTELSDTVNGHSTITNPARYVCQSASDGVYSVESTVYFTGNATGVRFVAVGVNGVTPQNGSAVGFATPPISGTIAIQTSADVFLNVGDYVQTLALQSSGGGLATAIGLPITSSMSVRWVANS